MKYTLSELFMYTDKGVAKKRFSVALNIDNVSNHSQAINLFHDSKVWHLPGE